MMKLLVCLLFMSYGKFCKASSGSCSSLGLQETFDTTCSDSEYYCDVDELCKSRDERCTGSLSCVNTLSGTEKGCDCNAAGCCEVTLNSYPLLSKKRAIRIEHDFVVYKGFVWEYGCYGTRVLDMNDPLFSQQRTSATRTTSQGDSSCTYREALLFLEHTGNRYSSARYSLFFNNCQDFAKAFTRWLKGNCTVRGRRDTTTTTTTDLDEYFEQLITENCSKIKYTVVCFCGSDRTDGTKFESRLGASDNAQR